MSWSRSAERDVLRSVKRVCHAGYDSVTLRQEVARRIEPLVGFDAYSIATVDPDVGLFTHSVAEGIPANVIRSWIDHVYPFEAVHAIMDLTRSGDSVATVTCPTTVELLRQGGFGPELRTVHTAGGSLWGTSCMIRSLGATPFGEREEGIMRRLAPHVAYGLRAAMVKDVAAVSGATGAGNAETGEPSLPGMVVLDARGRITLRTPAATAQMRDLADVGFGEDEIPYAVTSAVVQLRALLGADSEGGEIPWSSTLRARGRSGRWYTIRASHAEPGPDGAVSTMILIEPVGPGEVATILTRLYGLTPREREIVSLIARGEPTKRIASRLGISAYTVQEYVGGACEKVGVRGRRALIAAIYFDGYVEEVRGSHLEPTAPSARS